MVLYRGIREGGFSFFTNYESRKGTELAENPFGAMAFYWPHPGKQIRLEGSVERLSAKESDSYFRSRPLQSQVTGVISMQSRTLQDEVRFQADLEAAERSALEEPVQRPQYWGGYKLIPSAMEFWTHGDHRRHHRLLYVKKGSVWAASRLYP
jgi:pyridoxamine 5'-phosphate oxidase